MISWFANRFIRKDYNGFGKKSASTGQIKKPN